MTLDRAGLNGWQLTEIEKEISKDQRVSCSSPGLDKEWVQRQHPDHAAQAQNGQSVRADTASIWDFEQGGSQPRASHCQCRQPSRRMPILHGNADNRVRTRRLSCASPVVNA